MWARTALRLLWSAVAVFVVACGAPGPPGPALAVGAAPGPENILLANIYAAGLRYYGTAARV